MKEPCRNAGFFSLQKILQVLYFLHAQKNRCQWQDAKKLHLLSDWTDGEEFFSVVSSRIDTSGDARDGRILREIHDRLPEWISFVAIQESEIMLHQTWSEIEFFRCECIATVKSPTGKMMDSSWWSTWTISTIL